MNKAACLAALAGIITTGALAAQAPIAPPPARAEMPAMGGPAAEEPPAPVAPHAHASPSDSSEDAPVAPAPVLGIPDGQTQNTNAYKLTFGAPRATVPNRVLAWPFKPFSSPRPIRATFGEPRSVYIPRNGLSGMAWHQHLYSLNQVARVGPRNIHDGVDIVVRKGTLVYSIENGRARLGGQGKYARWVRVGNFRYDHVTPLVRQGQKVVAFKTPIARIATPDHHLHLTRYHKGVPVNPLAFGGFIGYRDTQAPQLSDIGFYTPEGGRQSVEAVSGRVAITVNARDRQSGPSLRTMLSRGLMPFSQWQALSEHGITGQISTGVYAIGYSIETEMGHTVIGPYLTYQADVIPPPIARDQIYQVASNRNDFVQHFWYRLTMRSPDGDGFINADALAPGRYRVSVVARDVAGNTTRSYFPFTVAPR